MERLMDRIADQLQVVLACSRMIKAKWTADAKLDIEVLHSIDAAVEKAKAAMTEEYNRSLLGKMRRHPLNVNNHSPLFIQATPFSLTEYAKVDNDRTPR